MNLKQISNLISTLAAIVVISADLGVDYTPRESQVYNSIIFQIAAVFSSAYIMLEDTNQAILLTTVWYSIKHII